MSTPRTFIIDAHVMQGADIKTWQADVKAAFSRLGIRCPIVVDGVYGQATRSFTAALCMAEGLASAKKAMEKGVTPELRIKLRNDALSDGEKKRRDSKARKDYRELLKKRWHQYNNLVHAPVSKIIADSWGYHPGVHDGLDVISIEGAAAFAMVRSRIIDVRASGWWGLGAPSDPALKARGDGIVQMEVLDNNGPFKRGMHIGYGHCEHAHVKVGQIVEAGEVVALVGFANAAHIHLMVNDGSAGLRGVGNIDPKPLVDYAVKHG